ncbi:hypothetical protein WA026_020406 [Henosepilachna vigintioctopunctata]|uniref:SOWAHA-C winged helix-turn-helix domain-containing protein n=1 Tax=Henosepilachna vigintioctopunctata TaxID=420089 RepID=A0AAW1UF38_9CUCU
MATRESDLTFEQVLQYFRDNGGSVKNRDVVTSFKKYLTDPDTKDDARVKFKEYVNKLAVSKLVNGEKFLYLKARYLQYQCPSSPDLTSSPKVNQVPKSHPPPLNPMNAIGIPVSPHPSPSHSTKDFATSSPRQPPPYRPPPPVTSPSPSLDTASLNSFSISLQESGTPQPPPRRKSFEKFKFTDEDRPPTPTTPTSKVELRKPEVVDESIEEEGDEKEANVSLSVKERTQKFNRLASVEGEERSPRSNKTPERTAKQATFNLNNRKELLSSSFFCEDKPDWTMNVYIVAVEKNGQVIFSMFSINM